MAGLTVQNFVSAAVGIAVVVALIRGIVARSGRRARQLLAGPGPHPPLHPGADLDRRRPLPRLPGGDPEPRRLHASSTPSTGGTQILGQGPVASQEVIKELGTNGGGFFNVNSSFPFENPSGLTNFFEMLLILVIPASLTYTYGRMVGSQRQGWAIFSAMFVLFVAGVVVVYIGRAARHRGPARRRASTPTPSTARPAATWRARSSASASPTPRSGRRSPRSPPAARSTPPSSR